MYQGSCACLCVRACACVCVHVCVCVRVCVAWLRYCLSVQVQQPVCPSMTSAAYLEAAAKGSNLTLCTPQQKNLNGSAIQLYNDTTYYDDLIFAATWLYKASGDTAYLTEAEAYYVDYLYSGVSLLSHFSSRHTLEKCKTYGFCPFFQLIPCFKKSPHDRWPGLPCPILQALCPASFCCCGSALL